MGARDVIVTAHADGLGAAVGVLCSMAPKRAVNTMAAEAPTPLCSNPKKIGAHRGDRYYNQG